MQLDNGKGIVLFDGVCHLCDGAVRFILKRERAAELKFAPLQSDSGKSLLEKYGYPQAYLDGLILIENNRAHDRSSACLRIAGKLNFPWRLLFPTDYTEASEGFYLRNHSSGSIPLVWQKESCSLPTGEDKARFL